MIEMSSRGVCGRPAFGYGSRAELITGVPRLEKEGKLERRGAGIFCIVLPFLRLARGVRVGLCPSFQDASDTKGMNLALPISESARWSLTIVPLNLNSKTPQASKVPTAMMPMMKLASTMASGSVFEPCPECIILDRPLNIDVWKRTEIRTTELSDGRM